MQTFSKLKHKILALLTFAFFISFLVQVVHRHYWLLPNLYALEREIDVKDVKRLAYAVNSLDDVLVAHVADNSIWDELYFAVEQRDMTFIEDTFYQGEQFTNIGINGYAFFDENNQLLSERSVDEHLSPIEIQDISLVTSEYLPYLTISKEQVKANKMSRTGQSGLIFFDGKPVIYAVSSIHRSNNQGKSIGSMLVWHYADVKVVEKLKQSSQLDVEIQLVNGQIPVEQDMPRLSRVSQEVTKLTRDENGYVSLLVEDVLAQPAATLRFKAHPRQFVDSLFDFGTLSLLLMALLLFTLIYLGIDRMVFAPTKHMLQWIREVIDTGKFTQSNQVTGASEFKLIEKQLNKLMSFLNEQEKQLVQAKVQAEQANELKGMFLANMSHEIRTPLHGILNLADLAQSENNIEIKNGKLRNIYNSGKILMNIVNDVLDFSKIEAGKLDIEQIEFDVREVIEAVVAPLTILAEDKKISLSSEIDERLTTPLIGDPVRVAQILNNLCSNAIKFTSEGEVKIMVNVVKEYADRQELLFEVTDTGIGIDDEKQSLLFGEFQQIDASTARKYGGTGLGLSICAKLSELMAGDLSFTSQLGKGTQFCYSQSFAISLIPQDVEKDIEPIDLCGAKILVAEDNLVNQTIIKAMLKRHNVDVVIVDNGLKCVEYFADNQVDLILMDIQMPEMDGIQASLAIRATDRGKHIPILAMTANTLKAEIENYFEIGMDGYIGKPFDKEKLNHLLTIFTPQQSQSNLQQLSSVVGNPSVSSELKLQEICSQIKRVLPMANRVSLWQFEDEMTKISCIKCLDENNEFSSGLELFATDFPDYFNYILTSQVLNASDARSHKVTQCFNESYFEPLNIHSLLDYIFHLDNKPAGVICCERVGDTTDWSEQDISFLIRAAKLTSLFFAEEIANQYSQDD